MGGGVYWGILCLYVIYYRLVIELLDSYKIMIALFKRGSRIE